MGPLSLVERLSSFHSMGSGNLQGLQLVLTTFIGDPTEFLLVPAVPHAAEQEHQDDGDDKAQYEATHSPHNDPGLADLHGSLQTSLRDSPSVGTTSSGTSRISAYGR